MIFIDFEVFKYDWLCVAVDSKTNKTHNIVNDREEFKRFYEDNVKDIWVGYNIRGYDQYIMKGLTLDMDINQINDHIIAGNQGWRFSNMFMKVPLNIYDVQTTYHSLKTLEGYMGENIEETDVSFELRRSLTQEEIDLTIQYCTHDVEQTVKVFFEKIEEFESHIGLINMFELPLKYISKTKAQLSAMILNARKPSVDRDDETDVTIVDTLKIDKYKDVLNWFENTTEWAEGGSLNYVVAGVPHIFGIGGIHGAIEKYIDEGEFINVDVGSYYPALMIEYDFLSRNVAQPKLFKEIRDKRITYKQQGDKRQQPLKIVLNSTYGASKAKFNQLYDPRQANNVCINGQLLLLDLIEKLEDYCEIINSNTDGLLIKVYSEKNKQKCIEICHEWEKRTRMTLDFEYYKKIYQGDVNNYIWIDENGKIKSKGTFKKRNSLDNNLAIVQEAIENYLVSNIPVEETIENCTDLLKFQMICHATSKYAYTMIGGFERDRGKPQHFEGKKLNEKTLRVYATTDKNAGTVYKVSKRTQNPEKFPNVSSNVVIDNNNSLGKDFIKKGLDKDWYIVYTKNELRKKFGNII